jgi:hypothetical protein
LRSVPEYGIVAPRNAASEIIDTQMDDTVTTEANKPPALLHQRAAMLIELGLQFISGAAIVGLLVMMANLDSLLAADESVGLVRVRLMKGVISFAMPLVIMVFLTGLRYRLGAMLANQNSDAEMVKSARYMWVTVVFFVLLILAIDVNIVIESLSDISFR